MYCVVPAACHSAESKITGMEGTAGEEVWTERAEQEGHREYHSCGTAWSDTIMEGACPCKCVHMHGASGPKVNPGADCGR